MYDNDKSRLGYYKFENCSQIKKTIFVKSNNACNNVQPRKLCHNVQHRNTYNNNYFYDHKKKIPNMELVFIVIVRDISLIHAIWEDLVYRVENMCGLRKELTKNDPKSFGYLERNINLLLKIQIANIVIYKLVLQDTRITFVMVG